MASLCQGSPPRSNGRSQPCVNIQAPRAPADCVRDLPLGLVIVKGSAVKKVSGIFALAVVVYGHFQPSMRDPNTPGFGTIASGEFRRRARATNRQIAHEGKFAVESLKTRPITALWIWCAGANATSVGAFTGCRSEAVRDLRLERRIDPAGNDHDSRSGCGQWMSQSWTAGKR
jgi:hypothetical protein